MGVQTVVEQVTKVLSWPFDKITDSTVAGQESPVADVHRYHRIRRWVAFRWALILILLLAISFSGSFSTWTLPLWMFTVYYAGTGATALLLRANAYRSGWMAGRIAMLGSMQEAINRNMGLAEWVQAEIERDAVMLAASSGGEVTVTVEIHKRPEDE